MLYVFIPVDIEKKYEKLIFFFFCHSNVHKREMIFEKLEALKLPKSIVFEIFN